VDMRILVSIGVAGLAILAVVRAGSNTGVTYWNLALPFLFQGFCMPFFFIPTNQIALSSVPPNEVASAAGMSNFLRTTSAAFATSLVTTFWENNSTKDHALLAGRINDPQGVLTTLGGGSGGGASSGLALNQLDQITQSQAVMLATDHMFQVMAVVFVVAAAVVWIAPRPKSASGPAPGGH
jgi:DHA2 family multidrug resistance protein